MRLPACTQPSHGLPSRTIDLLDDALWTLQRTHLVPLVLTRFARQQHVRVLRQHVKQRRGARLELPCNDEAWQALLRAVCNTAACAAALRSQGQARR